MSGIEVKTDWQPMDALPLRQHVHLIITIDGTMPEGRSVPPYSSLMAGAAVSADTIIRDYGRQEMDRKMFAGWIPVTPECACPWCLARRTP